MNKKMIIILVFSLIGSSSLLADENSRVLNPATRNHADARYLVNWKSKVKKVGNRYISETGILVKLKLKRSVSVLLDVAIKPSGELVDIRIIKSSGSSDYDQVAIDIVKKSAPFPRVSKQVMRGKKILHIVYSYRFSMR